MELTKEEILQLKGIAIIFIVGHNLLRILNFQECNECNFFISFLDYPLKWSIFPFQIFLYYGWMFLPVFIFISGIGLQKKYENGAIIWPKYIFWNLGKIIILFLPCFIICVLLGLTGLVNCPLTKRGILLQAIGITNFLYPTYYSWPGVYWYIGLTLQLYILFPFLRKLSNKQLIATIVLLCIFMQICCIINIQQMVLLRKNAIGWLHLFLLGILCAKTNVKTNYGNAIIVPLLLLTIITSCNKYTWIVPEICSLLAFILLFKKSN